MSGKKRFYIRKKVLLILCVVLFVTIVGNFVIGGEIFQKAQITAFDNEAFATARGLQTNINSLIEKSFLPYTEIINCEPLLDSFVEKNENVLYAYTTDINGNALYMSTGADSTLISSEQLADNVRLGLEESIDDENNHKLHYILPIYQVEEVNEEKVSTNVGVIVVTYPRTCITEPLTRFYSYNALLAIVTFACSLLLTFLLLTQWVTRPLQKLDKAILRVSQKGLDDGGRLEINSNDEIGQIAQSFNDMIVQLDVTTVSKNYINSILFNMSEALYVVDLDKRINTVNDAAVKLLGYSLDELQGKTIDFLYKDAKDNPFASEDFQKKIDADNYRNFETEFVSSKGEYIAVSVNWSSIRDSLGVITGFVCTARDITEIKEAQSIIMYQANFDELTGLCNRYNLEQSIEKILSDINKKHVFVMIDLDKFKVVNDVCGHTAGDKLLKQVAHMIKMVVGDNHMVARIGGDEFAIILYDTTMQEASVMIEELLKSVRNYNFTWENKVFNVGMSIGVFEINGPDIDRLTVFNSADKACYIAKEKGGNRMHVFSEQDKGIAGVDNESSMAPIITEAFENNRFFLVYQPIAELNSAGDACMYEVLVRLQTKDGNVLKPGAFMPTAERYNKLLMLDKWVVHNFCMNYQTNVNVKTGIKFSINLTKAAINSEDFYDFICNEFATYNVPAEAVCFEITENCAVSNFIDATNFMKKLRALGCSFALDNFGSGMSSFMYLRLLPVDIVKIDGSFVREINKSDVDMAVVNSINEIAHLLNIKTVASWVESKEILDKLKEVKVDYVQGFEIGRPVAIN